MAVLCVLLVVACFYDYRKRRIPNLLLLIMYAVGWVYRSLDIGAAGLFLFPAESVGVMLLMYPLFKIGILGAGDIKLYGICAGYLPSDKFLYFLFFSMLIAVIFSLFKMLKESNAIDRLFYLCEYVLDVAQTGNFRPYFTDEKERGAASICLAGPVLCSVLLYWGGVY